ncbi:MAG: 30S ribosomal protein S16 [Candidatus Omnitrophica bacterium]|nr:30S ribosomal protein S16 [Candidatus Omnitrophota bacterium]
MAVVIRLKRMGTTRKPCSRVVVTDSRSPRDGRFIEEIGYCDMRKDPVECKINKERAEYWIKNGAKPSPTVKSLLKKQKIV